MRDNWRQSFGPDSRFALLTEKFDSLNELWSYRIERKGHANFVYSLTGGRFSSPGNVSPRINVEYLTQGPEICVHLEFGIRSEEWADRRYQMVKRCLLRPDFNLSAELERFRRCCQRLDSLEIRLHDFRLADAEGR